MKKLTIFLVFVAFLCPFLSILGCNAFYEHAICKIGNKSYSSLSQAIQECESGQTIEVYNSCKTDSSNIFYTASAFGRDYVQYIIDKPLTIKGISQNYKKPKIYGSIVCSLTDEQQVCIQNVEVVNDYISLQDDRQNVAFKNAISITGGSAKIENCKIAKSQSVDNDIILQNNLTLLSGISILSNPVEQAKFSLSGNNISGYDNFNDENCSFALSLASEDEESLEKIMLNNQVATSAATRILSSNKLSGMTKFKIYSAAEGLYYYLSTCFQLIVKPEKFNHNSVVDFFGDVFGPALSKEQMVFNVYGTMSFVAVQNVHFVMKTPFACAKRNAAADKNVKITLFVNL